MKNTTDQTTEHHTPGPWQFRTYPDGCTIISTRPDIPGSMVLGRLKGVTVSVDARIDDNQANILDASPDARLIAAAPELLAALELAQTYIRQDAGIVHHAVACALAKARNEIPQNILNAALDPVSVNG